MKVRGEDITFKVTATKAHSEGRALISAGRGNIGLWYVRFGHVAPRILKMMVKNSFVLALPP